MAVVRLSAATLPWQCEISEGNEGRSFGFTASCSDTLPRELAAHPHLQGKAGPLFFVRSSSDQTWRIEPGDHSNEILFNGNPLSPTALADGDILTLSEGNHLLVSIEGMTGAKGEIKALKGTQKSPRAPQSQREVAPVKERELGKPPPSPPPSKRAKSPPTDPKRWKIAALAAVVGLALIGFGLQIKRGAANSPPPAPSGEIHEQPERLKSPPSPSTSSQEEFEDRQQSDSAVASHSDAAAEAEPLQSIAGSILAGRSKRLEERQREIANLFREHLLDPSERLAQALRRCADEVTADENRLARALRFALAARGARNANPKIIAISELALAQRIIELGSAVIPNVDSPADSTSAIQEPTPTSGASVAKPRSRSAMPFVSLGPLIAPRLKRWWRFETSLNARGVPPRATEATSSSQTATAEPSLG